MRKWSWLYVAVGIVLMPASPAALARSTPQLAATPACAVKSVAVSQSGQVTVRGVCTLKGRPILSTLAYSYTSSDKDKYSCGATKGTAVRGKFVLGPAGISAASGSLRYLPRAKYRRVASKIRPFRATLSGNDNLQCGKPVNLPSPSLLCDSSQWPDGGWASPVVNCGVPVPGGAAFASPPTFNPQTGILSVGHIVSPSGRCAYGPWNDDIMGPGPFMTPLGTVFHRVRLLCSDDVGVEVSVGLLWISNPAGYRCQGYTIPYSGSRKVQIPRDWAGTLWVKIDLQSYTQWSGNQKRVGFEMATARFQLPGTQYQC